MTELAAWYQRKISSYDKQEWETTIERRRAHELRQVPLKCTKLKSDLIDVDLIRGSSFPKAKPIQGLGTIVRLAIARVVFFPFWRHWWAAHTSKSATQLFLTLWCLQLFNVFLYVVAPVSVNFDSSCILVPFSLMVGLGIVHAFIVSTHPHHNGLRCLSLNHDKTHPCIVTSGIDKDELFRQSNTSSSDIFNSSSDYSQSRAAHSHFSLISSSTQTDLSNIPADLNAQKWGEGLCIPTVSLTPPVNQSVKFNLDSVSTKHKETSDESVSPLLRNRKINPRTSRISTEDDGFESLNGNNSNGSENGDDRVNYNEQNDGNETDIENDEKNDQEERKKTLKFNSNKEKTSLKLKKIRGNYFNEIKNNWDKDKERNAPEKYSSNGSNTLRFRAPQICSDGGSSTNLSGDHEHCESDDVYNVNWYKIMDGNSRNEVRLRKPRKDRNQHLVPSSDEECDTASASMGATSQNADFPPTTNNEACSYCSESGASESEGLEGDSAWEPFAILNPANERVSCTVWENNRVLKAQMSVVDISHSIAKRAEQVLSRNDSSLWPNALVAAVLASLLPIARLLQILVEIDSDQVTIWNLPTIFLSNSPIKLLCAAFGSTFWEQIINVVSCLLRLGLGTLVFFLLAVAQRAFNQRFLYAKLFSHLTSARRARQSSLPHFRLNRVRNIKAWLSVRSYLMKRGPQRSVDIIVSAAFVLLILLISLLVIDLLQDQSQVDQSRTVETLGWTAALGVMLLRLVALGTRASRKHRCLPVLLTEQINLHLAMERRPTSKDRLSVANNVLKLAADLLKELDSPFKISGLSANPYLYTITKVVVLSALSGVLSDLLGFKLKLHKIKIK